MRVPEVSARIKRLLAERELSQRELVRRGVPRSAIERAAQFGHITWKAALKLAPALGVRPEDLMPRE